MRIFLSYGHDANEELVRRIKADLERRGHDVWFDKSEIRFGDDWRREITDGIIGSNRVLSFLSKYSTRDPGVCLDELAIAIGAKGGNIQTILVESETEVKPPPSIGHIQWLDMHDWKDRRAAGEAAWEDWYQGKLAEIVRVIESDESRRFAGEIRTLEEHLKPISFDTRITQLLKKPLVGRTWLFDAVDQWRNAADRASRLFWIMGAPGVGKSAFAAHLAHYGRDKVIAVQFCEYDKPDHRDARRVIRTLAFQIATRLPDYRKLLLTLPEISELDRKNPAELFEYLFANPLKLAISGGRERYLVVIDALDEAGGNGSNELVEMLARNAPRLPDWIGIVATSRPESDVIAPLQGLNPSVLDTASDKNRDDIRDYLRRELAAPLREHPDADRLVEQILEKSEGVFLYVERFCDDVHCGNLSLDHPEQFPQGLGEIFFQYFKRQFTDLDKFRRDVRPALRAILAAREPLPLEILQRLFYWQDEELSDFTRPLASLFPFTTNAGHEVIKPYHKSLADWLADEAKAGAYFVSSLGGHRQLGDTGLACLLQESSQTISLAALGYWSRSLLYHFCSLKDWNKLVFCIAERRVFRNLWPGSYGLDVGSIYVFRNLWPESRSLAYYNEGSISVAADAIKPATLDSVPIEMNSNVAWAMATAFAERARELQLRAFATATEHGKASNKIHDFLRETPAFIGYCDLVYAFVYLAKLAPEFAMSGCQFEEVGSHQGHRILRSRDSGFQEKARRFLETYRAIRSYLRYLANFACNEGWSGQLESEAYLPDDAWQMLAILAYGREVARPQSFFKMSELGYNIEEKVDMEAPWGAIQTKEAGVDAFLVKDEQDNGEPQYYMVQMEADGTPVGWSKS